MFIQSDILLILVLLVLALIISSVEVTQPKAEKNKTE